MDDGTVKSISNLFKKNEENEAIKDRIIRDIKTLWKRKWLLNNNYIGYESNSDRNENLSVEGYLNETRPYLKDIITDLRKSGSWKIQLTVAIT